MKKTMMPLTVFSSGKRGSRTKRQASWTRVSFFALLVLLMIATTEAALSCNADAECRRNVCIYKSCAPRPSSGGACEANNHCVKYPATESCINSKCLARSNLEGPCEESTDCATSEAICQGNKCLMPDGKTCAKNSQCVPPLACIKAICGAQSPVEGDCDEAADCAISGSSCSSSKCTSPSGATCSANAQCTSPLACIKSVCAAKSPTGGDCDEDADCAKAGDSCTSNKCTFNPALMVWDGNKAPVNYAFDTPSVLVNGILFVFEVVGGSSDITVEAYDPVTKTWTSRAAPGLKNIDFTVVAVGNYIFLIGGTIIFTPQTTFYRYDTVSDKWETDWTPLPEPRYNCAAAVVDKTVFIFGGYGASGETNTIRSLDVSAKGNAWNLLPATLPDGTVGLSAAVVNKDIYLTGGSTSSATINTVLKYNTLTPTVSPVANAQGMVEPRSRHISFYDSTNKRLYALGGIYGNFQNTVEYLDLTNPTGPWASANAPNYIDVTSSFCGGLIGSLFHFVSSQSLQILDVSVPTSVKFSPFPNSPSPGATIVHMTSPNKITAVGTYSPKTVSFYNTVSNTWTTGSADFPRDFTFKAASAVVNGELYVMGGGFGNTGIADVYTLNAAGDKWTKKDDLPSPKTGGCAAAYGTDIYFYGGAPGIISNPGSTLYKMDTKASTGQWTTITYAGTPTAVMGCAAVVVGQKLLIFGGGTAANGASPIGKVQSFNLTTKTWDSPLPASADITPRSYLSAVFLKGFVFVIGGSTDGGFNPTSMAKVEVFDVNTESVTVIKDMLSPRAYLGSVTDGTSIFSVGGKSYGGFFPSFEKLHTP